MKDFFWTLIAWIRNEAHWAEVKTKARRLVHL